MLRRGPFLIPLTTEHGYAYTDTMSTDTTPTKFDLMVAERHREDGEELLARISELPNHARKQALVYLSGSAPEALERALDFAEGEREAF